MGIYETSTHRWLSDGDCTDCCAKHGELHDGWCPRSLSKRGGHSRVLTPSEYDEGAVAPLPEATAPSPEPVVNPKEIAGSKKPATWSVMPRWVTFLVGRVMQVGAAKYGAFNYRESRITASTYLDAIERHLHLWQDGEDDDPETGVSHLASVIAGCTLLLDAQATGKLADDRQKTGLARPTLDRLQELLTTLPLPKPQY